jgi:hypothetical protein
MVVDVVVAVAVAVVVEGRRRGGEGNVENG